MKEFKIHVSDYALSEIKQQLESYKMPRLFGEDWERGVPENYFNSLISYWKNHYNWKYHEHVLNAFNHYNVTIDGINIHFIHQKGKDKNSKPILLIHGWPDSFLRYTKTIDMLTNPTKYNLPVHSSFDIIIPSIPGITFSDTYPHKGLNNAETSEIYYKLMTDILGYDQFYLSGGDMGSGISRYLSSKHKNSVIGLHLTDVGIIRQLIFNTDEITNEFELEYKTMATEWMNNEGGYMNIQGTKPNTLSFGLSNSLIGLSAWIVEKFYTWSSQKSNLNFDDIITNIILYWVTNSIGSSINIYYENMHGLPTLESIKVPVGMTLCDEDVLLPPESWLTKNYPLVFLDRIDYCGHFTALEQPEKFVRSLLNFITTITQL